MKNTMRAIVSFVSLLAIGCTTSALPVEQQQHCGTSSLPCCAQDACDSGMECMTTDSGMASKFCYTPVSQGCGGAGESCCAVKEHSSGTAAWCMSGLGCGNDGVCN